MGDEEPFELEDGERIVWSERRTMTFLTFLRQPLTVAGALMLVGPALQLVRGGSWRPGAFSGDAVYQGAVALFLIAELGVLALYYAWIRQTQVTFTDRRALVIVPGYVRSTRLEDVTTVEVTRDKLVLRAPAVGEQPRGPADWFLVEPPAAADRLACPGLVDPRRVLEDLIAAGALEAEVEVVDRTRESLPSLWRPALLTLLGVGLWVGGVASAVALLDSQGKWVSGAVLLGGIGLGLLPFIRGLQGLGAAWIAPAEDA